ncbi:UPF0758 domain-containing protein [Subtercola sp. RTI3]|uniref:UPF0758 domain-containing protein n=1 Tax=Subtercola sp. RTI3 TaxID=3048639 RepID=UPI002B23A91B|nr:UPF0758 domain-containing protein [Subtercola sp. RTI3]MEA9984748.1 hypothetical protein [Subtercola sp. RTI3]
MKTTRTSLWSVAPGDRPREKLERLGPAGLSDSELVALVLGSGLPGVNVLDSATSLLSQAGGVAELMGMTVHELKALMGVGVATAGRVVAVAELWRRANDPGAGAVLEHPHDIVDAVRAFLMARASAAGGRVTTVVVVADSELRVRVVVPMASGEGEGIRPLVARVLHEVLYRGGAAFALAEVRPELPTDDARLYAVRDVLKLASATVGLRFLSTVVVTPDDWCAVE